MVHGWGINNADYPVNPRKGKSCPYYATWARMVERCHSKKTQERHSTYQGCSIVSEWKYFMTFKSWMIQQDWEGKQLDKDLLVKGNKVYGPDTCVFVTRQVNSFMTESNASRGEFKLGVHFHKLANKYQAGCCGLDGDKVYLGVHETEDLAHDAYLEQKYKFAVELANRQDNIKVKNALISRYYKGE